MSDSTQKLPDTALDILFRKARSYDAFAPDAVTDEQLRAIHEIMKHGPTSFSLFRSCGGPQVYSREW